MSSGEKTIAIVALIGLFTLPPLLFIVPRLHTLPFLVPLSLLLVGLNAALLFIVFKDIFMRRFKPERKRYLWVVLVFVFPPVILVYLPMHGFRERPDSL